MRLRKGAHTAPPASRSFEHQAARQLASIHQSGLSLDRPFVTSILQKVIVAYTSAPLATSKIRETLRADLRLLEPQRLLGVVTPSRLWADLWTEEITADISSAILPVYLNLLAETI